LFLVVLIGCESLTFFGWDSSLFWNNWSHDTTDSFNTKTQWSGINKDDISISFTTKNTTLDSSTISNSFIRVNTSVWFFTVEEIFDHLLDLWNSSRSTNEDDFINITLFETSIIKSSLNWTHCSFEKIGVDVFKSSSGKLFREIFTIEKVFNFNSDFMSSGKGSFSFFDFSLKFLLSFLVFRHVFSESFLEKFHEMVHNSLIEIFSS